MDLYAKTESGILRYSNIGARVATNTNKTGKATGRMAANFCIVFGVDDFVFVNRNGYPCNFVIKTACLAGLTIASQAVSFKFYF